MNNLNIAYAALLHDIGKFYQRTTKISLLNSQEIASTPIHANGYHTHIHSGYTAKFFHDYLHLNDQLEKASSGHHINEVDEFDSIIRDADRIASKIDRNDENFDFEENHKKTRYQYITSRLSSIMGNIDFGQTIYDSKFKLTSIDQCMNPCRNNIEQNTIESIEEYKKLFAQFIEEIKFDNLLIGKPTPYKYHRMYSLLYKYTTLIPSSTYETNNQTVSLFDHLKLTTAIASCLSQNNCNNFYMLEFDVSGIQSFIYKITEGSKTKTNIAKSLRGRSAFVTLITNAITYTILDKFKLTQANIIFNTGGGALLLLPYLDDTEKIIHNTFNTITKELYKRFNTSLSVVYAIEKVDKFELSNFKTEKALALKTKLEEYKLKKFYPLINNDFCVEHLEDKEICELCGQNYVKKDHKCQNCLDILNISDYYTKHDKFTILYSNLDYNNCLMDLGFIKIYFFEKIPHELINKNDFYYIDAVNHFEAGNVKLLANLVPKENNTILNFENITKTLDKSYGDEKLGVLKMDVDNLGAIFAFGLKQGKNNEKDINIIAYPKKWQMELSYIDMNEKADKMTGTAITMDIVKDKAGELQIIDMKLKEDYVIFILGKLDKSYDGNRKGMNLTKCLEGDLMSESDDELEYSGKPREKDWTKAVSYTKTAFKYYDKLLGKYGYSMKKIGFTKY